nr:hypothetical protein [Nitrosomonas nitrosa]
MKFIKMPGFTTDTSNSYGLEYQHTIKDIDTQSVEVRILPQQECTTYTGPCTHQWPWFTGTQCAETFNGNQQCCSKPFQYPYIRECPAPGGGVQVKERGCGFCI